MSEQVYKCRGMGDGKCNNLTTRVWCEACLELQRRNVEWSLRACAFGLDEARKWSQESRGK